MTWNNEGPKPGTRWVEVRSGRTIVVLKSEVYGTGPSYRYVDDPLSWHYCNVEDFITWGRFKRAEDAKMETT